ncbi:MAG: hypothetical protein GYB68_03725 [Chloroflexi bacterium]|nr:hypothetical protein [Chloroflexota bacterium]
MQRTVTLILLAVATSVLLTACGADRRLGSFRDTTSPDATIAAYTELAESILSDNPSPVEYRIVQGAPTATLRPGKVQFYGGAVDDPWIQPYVDVFKGAVGGWDTYLTLDPSEERPGSGQVDAYVGSYRTDRFGEGDQPGDLFIVGDFETPYFAGKTSTDDVDRDLVYIYHFEEQGSVIRLHGSPADYIVAPAFDPDTEFDGTAIFYTGSGTDDLIAWVGEMDSADMDLTGPHFEYDFAPDPTPMLTGFDQLGNGGTQVFGETAMDEAGNIYQTFLSSGPAFPGAQSEGSFYIVKWNNQGEQQWIQRYGVTPDAQNAGEMPFNIVANTEYVFVSGHTKGGFGGPAPIPNHNTDASYAFVAQVDAVSGDLLNVRRFTNPGFNGTAWSIGIDDSGEYVFVGGGESENNQFPLPHTSPFIAMLPQDDLSVAWEDIITDGGNQIRPRIRTQQLSNEAIATIAFARQPGTDGVIYVSGYGAQGDFLGGVPLITDAWVAKYDMAGNRLWATAFQASDGDQYPWAVAADDAGNVYIVGQTNGAMDGADFQGNGDGFIRKMSPDGEHLWTRLIGTELSDDLQDIRIFEDKIFVTGSTQGDLVGTNQGMTDGFIAMLDLDGNVLGLHQFGSEKADHARSLHIFGNTIYVGGMTEGSLVAPYQGGGGFDVFLATFNLDVLEQ